MNLNQEEIIIDRNKRRASSFNERYWQDRIISDWDASPIRVDQSVHNEQVGVLGESQNDDQITIFSAEEATEETVGDFVQSGEK